jgi:DNA-binding beta-propeller fold protein YncE
VSRRPEKGIQMSRSGSGRRSLVRRSGGGGGRVTAGLRVAGLIALAMVALLALTVGSASAKESHILTGSFGEKGSGPGQLQLQAPDISPTPAERSPGSGIAINQTSHDVYVADTGNGRVAEFEEGGTFLRAFGALTEPTFIAIDNSGGTSSGDVYVADTVAGSVFKFEADGTAVTGWGTGGKLTGFSQIKGIAVGPGGDLFVLSEDHNASRFDASGSPVGGPFETPRESNIAGLAIDTEGSLYKVAGSPNVTKFGPAGEELLSTLDAREDAVALAVDPSDNDLYVAQAGEGAPFVNRFAVTCGESCEPSESFGAGEVEAPSGIAVDGATHTVYIANATASRIDVFEAVTLPDATTEPASALTAHTATFHGLISAAGVPGATCVFQYLTEAAFQANPASARFQGAATAPCEPAGPFSGAGVEAVHADVTGLLTGTTYRYRLLATNPEGSNPGADLPFRTLGPTIDSTAVSAVSATAATLEAELNPHGAATTYRFQYGETAAYGSETTPGSAGAGSADVTGTAFVSGLQPATTYHFRVLAESHCNEGASLEVCVAEGPDRTFTTQPAAGSSLLPDGRGWELVSPALKQGIPLGAIIVEGSFIQAAADGSAITYYAKGSIVPEPSADRSVFNSQDLSTRGSAGGWSTIDISTPHQQPAPVTPGILSEYKLFSTDLSVAAVEPVGATRLSPQAGEKTPYLRLPDGSFEPLVNPSNVPFGTHFGGTESAPEIFGGDGVQFITATPDLSHVLLSSPARLVEGFETGGGPAIYEWRGGALTPVSFVPLGAATFCGGSACIPGEAEVGNQNVDLRNAISTEGTRVIFSNGGDLFLRDLTRGETVRLPAAEPGCGDCGSGGAVFQTASADGSRIFFTDAERLTAGSTAAAGKPDLYMCQITVEAGHLACSLTDLTENTLDPSEPATLQGPVIGAASDGSSVYFVANGNLTVGEGAVRGDCAGSNSTAGQSCNLYRYDTGTSSLSLVAVLSGGDLPDWAAGDPRGNLRKLTARVSPDGNWLAFMSERPLTGYDNRDAVSGERDEEVFLYDSSAEGGAGRLICPSCNPSGARPAGRQGPSGLPFPLVDGAENWLGRWYAANVPGWTNAELNHAVYQSRYLSNSGRLFFDAADALVPQDTNGTEDVYQYELPGVGSCTAASPGFAAADGGCVDLISSGTSAEESAFMDADEKGENVFLLTASRLTAKDEDSALDLYDARVDGGEIAPIKPVECSGDACQQPAVPAVHSTPGSLTFNGAGNVTECAKSKVKQKGKCVKKKQKKAKKHHRKGKPKKSNKKKGKKQKSKRGSSRYEGQK